MIPSTQLKLILWMGTSWKDLDHSTHVDPIMRTTWKNSKDSNHVDPIIGTTWKDS
jgi:hypothetical protein